MRAYHQQRAQPYLAAALRHRRAPVRARAGSLFNTDAAGRRDGVGRPQQRYLADGIPFLDGATIFASYMAARTISCAACPHRDVNATIFPC